MTGGNSLPFEMLEEIERQQEEQAKKRKASNNQKEKAKQE